MRNKKAFDFGFDREDVSFASAPYAWDYHNHDYDEDRVWWDEFYCNGIDSYRSVELARHKIKNSNRDYIRYCLTNVRRNTNCRHLFQDIIAGNFCITIEAATLLADKYYIDNLIRYAETLGDNGLSITIHEIIGSEYEYICPPEDLRFSMATWAHKFENRVGVGEDLTLDEIVEIIAHCVRIARANAFF